MLAWLKEATPDVVCLQEIKCEDQAFPRAPFEALGYNLAIHGQKTYNGVAILSKLPLEDVTPRLPGGDSDDHARYLEAVIAGKRVAFASPPSICPMAIRRIPTNSPTSSPGWTGSRSAARELLALEEPLVLCRRLQRHSRLRSMPSIRRSGWTTRCSCPRLAPQFRRLIGILASPMPFAPTSPGPGIYTFWDYQAGAWQKNNGIRIDHCLLSPQAADRFVGGTDRQACARLGQAVRPRAGGDRTGRLDFAPYGEGDRPQFQAANPATSRLNATLSGSTSSPSCSA